MEVVEGVELEVLSKDHGSWTDGRIPWHFIVEKNPRGKKNNYSTCYWFYKFEAVLWKNTLSFTCVLFCFTILSNFTMVFDSGLKNVRSQMVSPTNGFKLLQKSSSKMWEITMESHKPIEVFGGKTAIPSTSWTTIHRLSRPLPPTITTILGKVMRGSIALGDQFGFSGPNRHTTLVMCCRRNLFCCSKFPRKRQDGPWCYNRTSFGIAKEKKTFAPNMLCPFEPHLIMVHFQDSDKKDQTRSLTKNGFQLHATSHVQSFFSVPGEFVVLWCWYPDIHAVVL